MTTSSPHSSARSGTCSEKQRERLAPCPPGDIQLISDFPCFTCTWFLTRISTNIYVAIVYSHSCKYRLGRTAFSALYFTKLQETH